MASDDSILAGFSLNRRFVVIFAVLGAIFCHDGDCVSSGEPGVSGSPYNSFTISSFTYATTKLRPYEWRYIRVDIPPFFSSLSVALESDVDLDPKSIRNFSGNKLPMICLREGSPPVPDAYNTSLTGLVLDPISNVSFQDMKGLQNAEQCYPMQKNISMKLTNEQIFPGVWYWGLFNGIGSTRTQSKMINRGSVYSFSGNISVEGCATPSLWGQYCNQTVNMLSCAENYSSTGTNQTAEEVIFCRNSGSSCHQDSSPKIYSLNVVGIAEQLTIRVSDLSSNGSAYSNDSGIIMTCYARLGAIPLVTQHDYSANISINPLVIHSPRAGRWYIAIYLVYLKNETGELEDMNRKLCYSLDWLVQQCPEQKAGLNCTSERYTLQATVYVILILEGTYSQE